MPEKPYLYLCKNCRHKGVYGEGNKDNFEDWFCRKTKLLTSYVPCTNIKSCEVSKQFEEENDNEKSCEECIHIRVCSDTVTAADDCEDYISKDDITPMKYGHWILLRESEITGFNSEFAGRDPIGGYQCSNCKEEAIFDCNDEFVLSRYCPNCGCKMGGETI